MLIRISKWCVVGALALTLGAHWIFLQSAAWIGMIVSYSQQTSFTGALSMTFDGQHPCDLCHLIQHATSQDQQETGAESLKQLDKFVSFAQDAISAVARGERDAVFPYLRVPRHRHEHPPFPPPEPVPSLT